MRDGRRVLTTPPSQECMPEGRRLLVGQLIDRRHLISSAEATSMGAVRVWANHRLPGLRDAQRRGAVPSHDAPGRKNGVVRSKLDISHYIRAESAACQHDAVGDLSLICAEPTAARR